MKKMSAVLCALMLTLALAGEAWAGHTGPLRPNISDPSGDANGVNDQGVDLGTFFGDLDDGGSHAAADIRKVWFDNDHQSVSVTILTTEPPFNSDAALSLRVEANHGCLRFEAVVPGDTSDVSRGAWVSSVASTDCGNGIGPVPGSFRSHVTREGLGLTTLTFRLGSHPNLRPLSWFFLPTANTRLVIGKQELDLRFPQIDNTKEGISYRIEQVPPPSVAPPPVATGEPSGGPPPHADKGKDKKKDKGKGKGHEKHGCDHPGHGHGHDDDCPEEDDEQRFASGKPYLF